jgi:hypothetical protein
MKASVLRKYVVILSHITFDAHLANYSRIESEEGPMRMDGRASGRLCGQMNACTDVAPRSLIVIIK